MRVAGSNPVVRSTFVVRNWPPEGQFRAENTLEDREDRHPLGARGVPGFVVRFVATESSGGLVLAAAVVVALLWANSPWQHGYDSLWQATVHVHLGPIRVVDDLRHLVNDGLMAVFFFVVGLEITREVVVGELADVRVAALPVLGALGGMAAPALLYLAIAGGGAGGHGWGIPMATDIAFSLGVLSLVGSRAPGSLKLFLLTLAIVDDVGAIVVIALFYGGSIKAVATMAAVALVALTWALRRRGIGHPVLLAAIAVAAWYATYRSGIHATIAGVALALVTPARPGDDDRGRSPAERLEQRLHPLSTFAVLPVFALANAGLHLRTGMLRPTDAGAVAIGVAVGLVVGKALGIVGGAWLGTRLRVATLPPDLTWRHVAGAAALGGIGFTVSLFVAGLAFSDAALVDAATLGIFAASLAAAAIGATVLATAGPRR